MQALRRQLSTQRRHYVLAHQVAAPEILQRKRAGPTSKHAVGERAMLVGCSGGQR
jgi:hypothetical protein